MNMKSLPRRRLLERARNLFGPLHTQPEIRRRIVRFFQAPTVARWNNIHSIIIATDPWCTVWQAVILVDPAFPARVCLDERGQVAWPRIPSALTVARAIRRATSVER